MGVRSRGADARGRGRCDHGGEAAVGLRVPTRGAGGAAAALRGGGLRVHGAPAAKSSASAAASAAGNLRWRVNAVHHRPCWSTYPANADCQWSIRCGSGMAAAIQFSVADFNTDPGDFVSVWDGIPDADPTAAGKNEASRITQWSGTGLPPNTAGFGSPLGIRGQMWVTFTPGGNTPPQGGGFKAEAWCEPAINLGCTNQYAVNYNSVATVDELLSVDSCMMCAATGSVLTGTGERQVLDFMHGYYAVPCAWEIQCGENKAVALNFTALDLLTTNTRDEAALAALLSQYHFASLEEAHARGFPFSAPVVIVSDTIQLYDGAPNDASVRATALPYLEDYLAPFTALPDPEDYRANHHTEAIFTRTGQMMVVFSPLHETWNHGFRAEYWCVPAVMIGCMDHGSPNFLPSATVDDGTCVSGEAAALFSAFQFDLSSQPPGTWDGRYALTSWEGVSLGPYTNLSRVDLAEKSDLHFTLDESISDLASLSHLDLSNTGLHGTIPDSLSTLEHLTSLDLRNTEIRGTLPDWLTSAPLLASLHLSNTGLSGTLPPDLCTRVDRATNLQPDNWIHHATDGLGVPETDGSGALIDLHSMQLQGNIPDFSGCINLVSLRLNNNSFTGLPASLPPSISHVYLGDNPLGATPTELSNLTADLPLLNTMSVSLVNVPIILEDTSMTYISADRSLCNMFGVFGEQSGCKGTRVAKPTDCAVGRECSWLLQLYDADDLPAATGSLAFNLTIGYGCIPASCVTPASCVIPASGVIPASCDCVVPASSCTRCAAMVDNEDGTFTATVPADWIQEKGDHFFRFFHGEAEFQPNRDNNDPYATTGSDYDDLRAVNFAPIECPAGSHTEPDDAGSKCICERGFVSDGDGSTSCRRDCRQRGTQQGDDGECVCAEGFVPGTTEGTCDRCDSWVLCPGGDAPQALCPAGQVANSRQLCENCPSGKAGGRAAHCRTCTGNEVPNPERSACEACKPGQEPHLAKQPDAEQMICEACPLGKMSSAGQVCQACENDQEPTEGLTGCVCQFGFYNRSQLGDVVCGTRRAESVLDEGPQCAACRGDCLFCDGIVTAIKPGYATFKSSEDTTDDKQVTRVFHCPDDVEDGEYDAESTCSGDDRHRSAHFDTGGCMEGHEGALCHVCSDTFARKARSGHCTKCSEISGSSSSVWVYIALIALAVGLWHQQQNRTGPINVSESPLSMSLSSTDDTQRVGRMATAARCSFQPLRILITFAQVTAQLGDVLHVQYPPNVAALLAFMRRFVVNALSLLFNAECAGLGGFHRQWILRVLVLPLTLGALVLGRYAFQRKRGKSVALENAKAAAFYAIFLLYPTICNSSFGAFNCMDMSTLQDGTEGVLVLDYAVDCDSHTHVMFKLMSSAVIAIFGLGVPLMCLITVITLRQSASPGFDAAVQRIATQFDVTDDDAAHLVREVTMDQRYKLLTSAFLPGCFYWEAFDMLRKFTLVGVVSVLGSGSAGQIAVGSMLAFAFSTWQVKAWPYKQSADNYLRTATEIEVFLLTMVAFVFISNDYVENKEEYDSTLDLFLMVSFVVLVPLAFIATIVSKVKTTEHDEREARTAAADGTVSGDLHRAFRAYTMGITSEADRSELRRFIGGWNIQRSNAAFLSHGKTQAGSEARLVKLECVRLLGVANAQIFLDSDNLTDLRTLMTNVAESDVLILFNTKDVLSRPWVLVELHTAIEKQVPIVVLDIQNSYQSDRTAMLAALDDLPAYLQRNNPRAVDALTAVNLDPEPLGALLRDKLGRQEHLKFNPHSSASLIEAEVKALCNEIAAVACPDNARILAATVRGQRSVSWPVTGRKCATLIIFDETEAEAEAQALWLQRSLARTTELGDDRFVTCADVTAQNVVEADTVVLVQTKRVLQQSKSLLLLDAALRGHVPVLPVKLLTTDDAVNYSFGDAQAMLQNLQTHLEPAVLDALAVTELDAATVGHSLAELLPNVISRQLDIDGNVADAQLDDILTSLVEFALKRTDPSDSTANPLCSAATETFAF